VRGWLAVNLFLLVMVLIAAGMLYLSLASIRALALPDWVERSLVAFAAIAVLFATGMFGKVMLATLEKRSRAR